MKPDDVQVDWDDLRCLLQAARAKSLSAAARAMGVEHSTVGRRLHALEEALGVALITRSTDGLNLTDIGQRAVPLLEDMDRAAAAFLELSRSRKTRVRLATPTGFNRIISARVPAFQAKHPDIILDVSSGTPRVDLKRSEADLAIRVGPSDDEELVSKKLGEVGWSLYASVDYLARHPRPTAPWDSTGHDLVTFDRDLPGAAGTRWLEAHATGANVVMRCRELTDLVDACVRGLGLAVLPCGFAGTEPALQRLTAEILESGRLSLVYRKEVLVAAPIRAVIQFVTELVAEWADRLSGRV